MAVTDPKNVITFKQKPVIIIRDKETLDLFKDENLGYVLKFLRKEPMTIGDLEESFRKIGIEKSDKSIYRYLHKLLEVKLVAKAGKRITSKTSDNLTSETIYTRSAIAFITVAPVTEPGSDKKGANSVWEATRLLLSEYFGKNASEKEFVKFANKLDKDRDELVVNLFENAKDETLEKVAQLDYQGINFLLQYIGWLAIIPEQDIARDLEQIFVK
ncbi:MAG: hypothetical protein GNW80_09865 [Asgard group archaeon]|nr:hypothetical protein [Asgard group archaeon]